MNMVLYYGWRHFIPKAEVRKLYYQDGMAPLSIYLGSIPTKDKLIEAITKQILTGEKFTVPMEFGFAACHWKDDFIKKTGRELAKERAKLQFFEVEGANLQNVVNAFSVHFRGEDMQTVLSIAYTSERERPYVHFYQCGKWAPVQEGVQ